MRYTVVWLASALDDLLSIWVDGPHREAISAAANGIDEVLRIDPILRGETLTDSLRVLITEPLVAYYRIIEADRTVQIVGLSRAPEIDDAL